VVLETESEGSFPKQSNKSTGGTFPSMLTAFGIPDRVVMQFTDSVVLESPSRHYVSDQPGAVLEFAEFKRFLVEDGQRRGAEYRWDARVSAPIMDDGQIVGVRYGGDAEVYGEIIVDATGPAAPLARALGVTELHRDHQAIGIEFECEGVALEHPGVCGPPSRDDAAVGSQHRPWGVLLDLPHRRRHREGGRVLHPEREPPSPGGRRDDDR